MGRRKEIFLAPVSHLAMVTWEVPSLLAKSTWVMPHLLRHSFSSFPVITKYITNGYICQVKKFSIIQEHSSSPPILCVLRSVRCVLSVHGFDFIWVLAVFSPVHYPSQVSDSSTLHPVQLFHVNHGPGMVASLLGDHGLAKGQV